VSAVRFRPCARLLGPTPKPSVSIPAVRFVNARKRCASFVAARVELAAGAVASDARGRRVRRLRPSCWTPSGASMTARPVYGDIDVRRAGRPEPSCGPARPSSCTDVAVTSTPSAVSHDTCTCSRGHLRLSCVTSAAVHVNGPAVLHDTRGCPRGQAHLSSMTGAPARDVRRPVPRNRSICHGGQVRLSTRTPCPASVAGPDVSMDAARVPHDGCGCHRGRMHLLRMTPAGVLVDRCTCHACRCGCLHRRLHESADATALCLVADARVWRNTRERRRARLRAAARRYRS
jgi:hypothetical protein